ncbi:MAG: ABC transporter ATP-binding protein [Betaproteobacteria bacterium]|nr:ABC transporter ATP-binding protein [Betaproteobacteria bacterium]
MLSVSGLTKRFGGFTAVNGISFDVREGEILGLIGPNGSGKSTTFNLIAGALAPSAGCVRFQGREIAGYPPYRVAHEGIARTHQIPRPFHRLSLLENVALAAHYGAQKRPSRERAFGRAAEILQLVNLPSDSHARTEALGAAGLKKLELARALATEPKLLLADESLGGLDEHEMDQAADMLHRIRTQHGITIIWVEHIMGVLMRVADRCVVLDHGEIVAQGTPQEIAHDPKVIEVYLGTDAVEVQASVAGKDR